MFRLYMPTGRQCFCSAFVLVPFRIRLDMTLHILQQRYWFAAYLAVGSLVFPKLPFYLCSPAYECAPWWSVRWHYLIQICHQSHHWPSPFQLLTKKRQLCLAVYIEQLFSSSFYEYHIAISSSIIIPLFSVALFCSQLRPVPIFHNRKLVRLWWPWQTRLTVWFKRTTAIAISSFQEVLCDVERQEECLGISSAYFTNPHSTLTPCHTKVTYHTSSTMLTSHTWQ